MIGLAVAMVLAQGVLTPDPRLETFKAACVPHRQDLEATADALAETGWVRVGDDDHPELAASLAVVAAEMADPEGPPMTNAYSVWARQVEGVRLHLVLNRIDTVLREEADDDADGVIQDWERRDEMSLLGCGVWDFDATAPVHPGLMTAWTGALAVQTVDLPGRIEGGTWNVHHMMPGTGEVHLGFIPDGSDMVARTGFSGVSITMSSAPAEADRVD